MINQLTDQSCLIDWLIDWLWERRSRRSGNGRFTSILNTPKSTNFFDLEITSNFESLIIYLLLTEWLSDHLQLIDWPIHWMAWLIDWLSDHQSHPLILPNMDNLTYTHSQLHTAEIFYYNCDNLQNLETFPHLQFFSHVWFIVHSRCYFTTRHLENFLNIFGLRKCFSRFLIFHCNQLSSWDGGL